MTSPAATQRAGEGPNVVNVNGLWVDADTGEIVGVATAPTVAGNLEPFRVRDRESAEWVLEKLLDAEAEIAALDRRRDVIVRNIEAQKAEHERRASWLRDRFAPELEEWARGELEGKKSRTVRTPFGKLSFRKRGPRLVVVDEPAAIEFANLMCPAAVKTTERFLVSEYVGPTPPGCEVEPERDAFKIDTGVEST